jgi:hypothetical protein
MPDDVEIVFVQTAISIDEYKELEALLKADSSLVLKHRVRKTASVIPPGAEPMWDFALKLAAEAAPHLRHLVKDQAATAITSAVGGYVGATVKGWVERRNAAKQKEIKAGTEQPLLYDAYDQVITVESKKRL